jgi:hypothetical protein
MSQTDNIALLSALETCAEASKAYTDKKVNEKSSIGAVGSADKSEIFNDYKNNTAEGFASHAEGYQTHATKAYSHSEGSYTTASGLNSHAEGLNTIASGDYSHAEGSEAQATNTGAHAEGAGS